MIEPNTPVWRYMSFAKLVSLLQKKQLWLSSAELLGDKWELTPNSTQLNSIINNRPTSKSPESAVNETAEAVKELRKQTFINCWTVSKHESHALWRIYCPSSEGVAIQTTYNRLKKSVSLPVLEVTYNPQKVDNETLDAKRLVTQKRPMFAYEQEVRIVLVHDFSNPGSKNRKTIGMYLDWDPELHLEKIWVHPEAHPWFMETVTETVQRLAPNLSRNGSLVVCWSKMNISPPF